MKIPSRDLRVSLSGIVVPHPAGVAYVTGLCERALYEQGAAERYESRLAVRLGK